MKLHHLISFGLMTAGALISAKAGRKRWQWETGHKTAAIMLDWDDVQAVATRAATLYDQAERFPQAVETLLHEYRRSGATHVSIPELTLKRLLDRGDLSVAHGSKIERNYLRAKDRDLAELVAGELQARLPHLKATISTAKQPLISFEGDLPTVAEVGLGFNPAQADLVLSIGLFPVARPVGYSWVQPEMITRTLDQAAALGVKVVAVRGELTPGFEFKIQDTVEAMRRNGLTYAYFSESRHQRGDWFLAKNLTEDGLVVLAHEFEPAELLEEDWHTVSDRWANLAVEAGIRLCSVRFFRVIHAADPLESVAYIQTLAGALHRAGFKTGQTEAVDLSASPLQRDSVALAGVGVGAAGAVGLAADLLPLPDHLKVAGTATAALALAGLPYLEKSRLGHAHHHHHDHGHHHHHHHHDHDHHSHDRLRVTAYAPKGVALATTVAYPLAAVAVDGAHPLAALGRAALIGATGAANLSATTTETDYLLGVEIYRGYNLDWLVPLVAAAATSLTAKQAGVWRWLPLAGVALAGLKLLNQGLDQDTLAQLDREHRHAHTHHLSAFQRVVGDSKMALSPKPLRKWALLAPVGATGAVLLKRNGQDALAAAALTAAAAGQAATLAGFRNGQRPLATTLLGRAKAWSIGAVLAGAVWLVAWLFENSNLDR